MALKLDNLDALTRETLVKPNSKPEHHHQNGFGTTAKMKLLDCCYASYI